MLYRLLKYIVCIILRSTGITLRSLSNTCCFTIKMLSNAGIPARAMVELLLLLDSMMLKCLAVNILSTALTYCSSVVIGAIF